MLTILIVDDNVSFRSQAARLCQKEGFSTIEAGGVSDLAHVLTTATPDLVLIDIELPQIPGHRLGALIRSRRPGARVLVPAGGCGWGSCRRGPRIAGGGCSRRRRRMAGSASR